MRNSTSGWIRRSRASTALPPAGEAIGSTRPSSDVGGLPAQRALEVDDAAGAQQSAQRALGFLLDLFPAGFGDGRAIAE